MKKMAVFISIFIMAILLFSAIFLFIQNQTLKQEIGVLNNKIADLEKSMPTPTPTTTSTKTVSDNIPKGWKEYINEEYKFKIWYPEEVNTVASDKVSISISENSYDIG